MPVCLDQPWEHPDWYDLHDNTHTAGPDREPEHYREFVLTLPPLDREDHLVDIGAGTGKLALLVAQGYPHLGQVTLIDPNADKLVRAQTRLTAALPDGKITTMTAALGTRKPLPDLHGTLAIIGSVLMPTLELQGGPLTDGLAWLRRVLIDVHGLLQPGCWVYDLETLAAPWAQSGLSDPARRLHLPELADEFWRAGFASVECMYRFRDRVVLRAQKPTAQR